MTGSTDRPPRRFLLAVLCLVLSLGALFVRPEALIGPAALGGMDRRADEVTEDALERAMAAFAIARGLNAGISVIKDSEIAVSPAGLGVTLQPGEVLDPADDLVERFGNVMLYSTIALACHRLSLTLGRAFALDVLLPVALLLIGLGLAVPGSIGQRLLGAGGWTTAAALLLRIGVPLALIASAAISDRLLAQTYSDKLGELAESEAELGGLVPSDDEMSVVRTDEEAEDDGVLRQLRRSLLGALETLRQAPARARAAGAVLADLPRAVVELSAAFLFETTIAPIGLLWLLWQFCKRVFARSGDEKKRASPAMTG